MTLLDEIYTGVYEKGLPQNKIQYVLKLKDEKIDYIFLGSSRVQRHIVTDIVEKKTGKNAINLGVSGATLDDVYLLLKLMVNNNVKADKVFVQVDYAFNTNEPLKIVGSEALPFVKSNAVIKSHLKENPDFKNYIYIPFYRYTKNDFKIGFREFFSNLRGKQSKEDFEDGFEPTVKRKVQLSKDYSFPDTIISKNDSFNGIQELCKANNIEIVYFIAPLCKELNTDNYIEKLKSKVPNLVDFSSIVSEQELFYDCLHLNEEGAEKFTTIFIDSCIINTKQLNKI
ncbi:hypothetical protein [Flavobacterium sp.]|uniref:hypothetical protein n=1 Tax=Flavobacterium sp. TaxID=239 RepID=UPI0028BE6879|nr:hypothetical protein [Flavobacterium sp.]